MNFHFSMEDCQFYVNKEKRTIACVLEHTQSMFIDYMNEVLYIDLESINPRRFYTTKDESAVLRMPDRFVGVAKCSTDDEWNEKLGRRIAYLRLREKVYHSFFKRAKTYVDIIDNYLDQSVLKINTLGEKLDGELENRNAHIAEALSFSE